MITVFPDYYNKFRCIKGDCQHNCCIGWEIDIDADTLDFYGNVKGEFGNRLCKNISRDGDPHFILDSKERCPFLNGQNLCDIIIELGEEHLCGICADHPRFKNELPERVEVGLGLCCEAAAELILCKREPVTFNFPQTDDEIILLRDRVILVLQDRSIPLKERFANALNLCGVTMAETDFALWADILLGLERLDDDWTRLLNLLKDKSVTVDTADFERYMSAFSYEYEQLAVYLVYRHMANAPDLDEAALRVAFAVLCCRIVYMVGACIWSERKEFPVCERIEIARLFSSEIEYSDENLYKVLDQLFKQIIFI